MRHLPGTALIFGLLFVAGPVCQAGVIVSLASDAPDLSNLSLGQTVTFNVSLSGLNPGDSLDFLGTDIQFDGTLLGTPTSITPGAIVPDVTGFAAGASPGVASALYDDLFAFSALPITSNGSFFTFSLTALTTGSGTISFDPAPSSFGTDSLGDFLPDVTAGQPLDFNVQGTVLVPEPSSFVIFATAFASAGVRRLFRRRRQKSC